MNRKRLPVVTPAGRRGKHTGRMRGHKTGRYFVRRSIPDSITAVNRRAVRSSLVITLPLVPMFYSISALDLKILKWEPGKH